MKKPTIIFLLLLSISVSLSAQVRFRLGSDTSIRKLNAAVQAITALYVDTVDDQKLAEDAIRGMITKLDPHSAYLTARENKLSTESLSGSFEGIGVQFNFDNDTVLVVQTVIDGPSERAGILAGDRIITVNDTTIAGVKLAREEIVRRLRGKKGSHVRLGILRRGVSGIIPFDVERDKIPLKTLDAAYMIRPFTGYIRINSFGATTYDEFMEAVKDLQSQGMTHLMIDLQENSGGYLQAAAQVIDEFLARNDLIVYTQGRATGRQEYHASGRGSLQSMPVTVLINEFSASASEILAGAIQDQDRGMIVGRRSFGKGLVQRPVDFSDGSSIRITTAHYYTPSGRCIQKPYTKGNKADYDKDLDTRYRHGEMSSADSIHFADSLRFYTLRQHRAVYGGGGIMPDYFVPLDTTQYTALHRQMAAKGVITQGYLKYIDTHRKQLKKQYATFDKYLKQFEMPDDFVHNLIHEAAQKGIEPANEEEEQLTVPAIKQQMKALLARDLWSNKEYFIIMNETNHIVRKALEQIENEHARKPDET